MNADKSDQIKFYRRSSALLWKQFCGFAAPAPTGRASPGQRPI